MSTSTLPTLALPAELASVAQNAWDRILEQAGDLRPRFAAALADPVLAAQLAKVLACSPFVAETIQRRPAILLTLLEDDGLTSSLTQRELWEELDAMLVAQGAELDVCLRQFRARHMLRIVWRDFTRAADTQETVAAVSALADTCIELTLRQCQAELEARYGRPRGAQSGDLQHLIVLAMGKLGARELNVSSDIDLIFAYPESGQTDGVDSSISNDEFFIKVGQAFIAALDRITLEGFVFRVDMRLRPYGDSGTLVHNFNALEAYYQEQGRDWERYALIKARPVTGDPVAAAQLMDALRPFVFRRYIDFGIIESLRSMKQMINTEVRRKGLSQDIKLGHGGIREVEFIAQCFQLIRGGRDVQLQQRELLPVLAACAELGCLPPDVVEQLRVAYLFLRDSEHAIQGYQDKQSQALPQGARAQAAMASVMGFESWPAYLEELDQHRQRVAGHFRQLIASDDEPGEDEGLLPWDESLSEDALAAQGFEDPKRSLSLLRDLHSSTRVEGLQREGRQRLDDFIPQLLQACAQAESPSVTLSRILGLVSAVLRRSAYLALLLENPQALRELVALCAASPWIAEQIARHPVLLDELLDRRSLYSAPDRSALREELSMQMARLAPDDLEGQMDSLRYFKASQVLRVAASEITGRLPLMKVSDKLTFIAEVILDKVLEVAWGDLTRKHGLPQREGAGSGFTVFGYGKLGGIELGYSSDLDLVFIYEADRQGVTTGPRSIDNSVFYTRLGQRIIHILDARMSLGQLYEVDMRLRPSGESGMLVISAEGFRSYQLESAWTWEHQALVRARFVAGDVQVAQRVEAVRREILALPREQAELAREVVAMRHKMRRQLLPSTGTGEDSFNLKQSPGGMVDIEFMVQYAVLAWSAGVPALARWSDNVRLLETLAEHKLIEPEISRALIDAYLAYRAGAHQLALQQQPGVVANGQYSAMREAVGTQWQRLFADAEETVNDGQ